MSHPAKPTHIVPPKETHTEKPSTQSEKPKEQHSTPSTSANPESSSSRPTPKPTPKPTPAKPWPRPKPKPIGPAKPKEKYRCVKQGTAAKFPFVHLTNEETPQAIGSDGAPVCFIFFVPTTQGNCLVGHIDNNKALVKNDSNDARFKAIVEDAEHHIKQLLSNDTVHEEAKWYTIKTQDPGLAEAITEGIKLATGVKSEPISEQREGFLVDMVKGEQKVIWANANGIPGFDQEPVAGDHLWTNEI